MRGGLMHFLYRSPAETGLNENTESTGWGSRNPSGVRRNDSSCRESVARKADWATGAVRGMEEVSVLWRSLRGCAAGAAFVC
jgi:hypothetical protein